MKSRPLAPMSSASANSAGRIGAEGWPPSVLLQSSKSSAWDAVPFTSAASSGAVLRLPPKMRLGPVTPRVAMPSTMRVASSRAPASVTPTVSRMPTFAQ